MGKKPIERSSGKAKRGLKPARFLDPKSDLVFKRIFGEHPQLIMSFLNGVLPLPEDGLIESIEYLLPEQTPRIPEMKNTIVDVKCTDKIGRIFIVEMQLNWTSHFTKRLLFGASKAYVQQLKQGESYEALCPVYGLSIINDTFDTSDEWYHHYRTVNVRDSTKILAGLELIFLELPKFRPETKEHRRMGVLWLRFLREIDEYAVDVAEEFSNDPHLSQALEVAQESSYSPAELDAYDKFWDGVRNERGVVTDSIKARAEAKEAKAEAKEAKAEAKEAKAEARKAEAKAQKAEAEAQEAKMKAKAAEDKAKEDQLATAKAFLQIGLDPHIVAQSTKLPLEVVLKLASM